MLIRLTELEACAWWSEMDAGCHLKDKLGQWAGILPMADDTDRTRWKLIHKMVDRGEWEAYCDETSEKVGQQLADLRKPDPNDPIEIDVPQDIKDLLEECGYF